LNDAITRSSGDYIAVLNSDDFFLPSKLADQVAFLDDHPEVGATFGLVRLVDEAGNDLSDGNHPYSRVFRSFADDTPPRHFWLRYFFFSGNALCHPTAMVRRVCYDRVGLYDPSLMQLPDLDMWIRLCSAYEINVSSAIVTCFRIRSDEGSVSGQRPEASVRLLWEQHQVLRRFLVLDRSNRAATFAADLPESQEIAEADWPTALAHLALSIDSIAHHAFALEVLQHEVGRGNGGTSPRQLFELTGSKDIYDLLGRQELARLRAEHDAVVSSVYWRGMAPVRRGVAAVRRLGVGGAGRGG
jgi:hypothetical protein